MSSGAALLASSKMAIYDSPMRNVLAYITSASIAVGCLFDASFQGRSAPIECGCQLHARRYVFKALEAG